MYKIIIGLLTLACANAAAQPLRYTVANAHSHNDYEQPVPFYTAYNAGFGSIEADIFLINGNLIVAHSMDEVQKNRSLEEYYLKPLEDFVEKNHGQAYADTVRRLQILIDVKTAPVPTLDAFVVLLKKHPLLTTTPSITWVISGNRPADSLFASYPFFIAFDGLFKQYDEQALQKVVMISDDFKHYSQWNGTGQLPAEDNIKLYKAIAFCHAHHKTVRFWDAPDTPEAWKQFLQLGVDYINTDHIAELANFLQKNAVTGAK